MLDVGRGSWNRTNDSGVKGRCLTSWLFLYGAGELTPDGARATRKIMLASVIPKAYWSKSQTRILTPICHKGSFGETCTAVFYYYITAFFTRCQGGSAKFLY